jgi:predicted MPP superfamily phosphohydrolase
MRRFFSRVTLIVLLLHLYIAARIIPELRTPGAAIAIGLWLCASFMLIPLAMTVRRREGGGRQDILAWTGFIAMGLFSFALVLTILRDVFLAVLAMARQGRALLDVIEPASARAVPILAVLLSVIAIWQARRRASVRQVDVPVPGLPEALNGFLIVQITDVHVGPTIKRGYVDAIVEAVNAQQPDMIAVTGDVVDGSVPALRDEIAPFARLRARHGVFFVTGNHEYYSGAHAWIAELQRLGLRVLLNAHAVLWHAGEPLVVAGVADYSAQHFDPAHRSDPHAAVAGAPPEAVRILLAHQPRSAQAAAGAGFALQISGHTHGGQFLPWNFFVRFQQPFVHGLERVNEGWIYTSRGTGYWGPPMRLGAPSEITRLRLVRA